MIASQSDTSTPSLVIVTLLMFGMLAPMDPSLRMVSEFLPANLYVDTVMAMAAGRSPLMGWAARCGDQPDMAYGLPDAVPLVPAAVPRRRAVSCPGRVA